MSQRTRDIIANVLLGAGALIVIVFIVTHFMAQPRPSWRNDMLWIGLACLIIARPMRGRRRGMTDPG